jgi:hypothetical protein
MNGEKIYHIYLKEQCVYHSLSEEEFQKNWSTLKHLSEFLYGNYKSSDLSYEEILINSN